MSKRKSKEIDEGLEFDNMFGTFQAESVDDESRPLFKTVLIGEEFAQPCHCCGSQPKLHIADFRNPEEHPGKVYVCCSHCLSCDGKWYASREEALEQWNFLNMGSMPRDPSVKDERDLVDDIMDDFRIPD